MTYISILYSYLLLDLPTNTFARFRFILRLFKYTVSNKDII